MITASEFGGQFNIQMFSSSRSFSSFEEFDTTSKTEVESMRGTSTSRGEQMAASQDAQTGSDSYRDQKLASESSKSSSETTEDGWNAGAGGSQTGGGVGGMVKGGQDFTTSKDDESGDLSEKTESEKRAEQARTEKAQQIYAEKSKNSGKAKFKNNEVFEKSSEFQQSMSKQKNVKFHVEGGTDLEFTHWFYSESFPKYFSRWIDSVILDPKSFNFKTKPIYTLLKMNAFDFFPQCATQCGFGLDHCEIKYPPAECSDFPCETRKVSISCQELNKISQKIQQKHSMLTDAVTLYLKHGRLTPKEKQTFRAGPNGCTEIRWPLFESHREFIKTQLGIPALTQNMNDLKESDLVMIQAGFT